MKCWRPALLLTLLLSGCAGTALPAPPAPPAASAPASIDSLLAQPPFDHVHWGILALDPTTGRTIYERNADRLFIPASNMKLPVTIAALGLLGPDFRWQTRFYAHARSIDGVLPGDLYLPGHGDPTLGLPFYDPPERALEALADSLLAAGVREVEGRLVVDVSAWDSTTVPESWMMEDLDGAYGATGGAFSVNAGELRIEVLASAEPGEPAVVHWAPGGAGAFVVHEVETVQAPAAGEPPPELRLEFRPESRHWMLTGRIQVGREETLVRSSRDPVRLATSALAAALADRGIRVHGGTAIIWDRDQPIESSCGSGRIPSCAEMLPIAGIVSPPLASVVEAILGPSQNWMTEQLVRTLGAELGEEGSWSEGFDQILGYLTRQVGIDTMDVHFEDGSGLSAQNLLSPRALVAMLTHAAGRPWGDSYRAALARPGAEETTLESRLEELQGRVHAKTGTISHVNSLSGYLATPEGEELVFSILSNGANLPAGAVRDRIDRILARMAIEPPG